MFLFLSKLLPLLLYPVGLTLVLVIVAFILLWRKRPKPARVALVTAVLILWVTSTSGFQQWIVGSLERQYTPQMLPNADAIVVLGGATASATPPRPWVEVLDSGDRVLYAAKLYRDRKAPKLILSGGRIDWKGAGDPESKDMAVLLETMGVPRSAMLEDPSSLNTRENAINVQKIMQDNGIKRILLVTSAMHMPRSMLIFQKLGLDAIAAPTDFQTADSGEMTTSQGRLLSLLPDAEPLFWTTRAFKEYIGILIYRLRGWA